jgi:hypothetical protein
MSCAIHIVWNLPMEGETPSSRASGVVRELTAIPERAYAQILVLNEGLHAAARSPTMAAILRRKRAYL